MDEIHPWLAVEMFAFLIRGIILEHVQRPHGRSQICLDTLTHTDTLPLATIDLGDYLQMCDPVFHVMFQDLALHGVSMFPDDYSEGPGETGRLAAHIHHLHSQWHHGQPGQCHLLALQGRGDACQSCLIGTQTDTHTHRVIQLFMVTENI